VTPKDQLYQAVGRLVRAGRRRAKLTQDDLAQRVGLTRTSLTNIERGKQKIQVHTLYAIAEVLGFPPAALLPPQAWMYTPEAIEERLPESLLPEEREWVKRVLATREE